MGMEKREGKGDKEGQRERKRMREQESEREKEQVFKVFPLLETHWVKIVPFLFVPVISDL